MDKIAIEINLLIENFIYQFDGAKLANSIKNDQELKKKLNQLLKTNNLKFKIDLIPEPQHKDTVKSWHSRASSDQIPKIKVSALMDDCNIDLSDQKTGDIGIFLSLEKSVNEKMQNELELRLESRMSEILSNQTKIIKEAIDNAVNRVKDENKPILDSLERQLLASEVIHPLANYISVFRKKILKEINKENMLGNEITSWEDLQRTVCVNKKLQVIDSAVSNLGLNLEDWYTLKELSYVIKKLKHPSPLELDESESQINALIRTKYEDYVPSFKNLIKLFQEKQWTE